MTADADDDRPLLTREDLRAAALRAACALPVLLPWACVQRGPHGVLRLSTAEVWIGLTLVPVVLGAALVDRAGIRRGWPALRTALVTGLLGFVGGFAARLQARSSGLDFLEGRGEAQVARSLARVGLANLERALALPLSVGFGLALVGLVVHASRVRPERRTLHGVVGGAACLIACLLAWRWLRSGDVGFLVASVGLVALALVLDRRGEPAPAGVWSWTDGLLVACVALLLLAPPAGRMLHSMRRANAISEAERRLEAALATTEPRAALEQLDASIALRDDPRARLERARRRIALGRRTEAEEDLEAASLPVADGELDPALRVEALVAWGDLVLPDYDRALSAIDKYTRALDLLDPSTFELDLQRRALEGRFAAHVSIQDDALADRDATRLLDVELHTGAAWLRRGLARWLAGRQAEARQDVARAVERGSPEAVMWAAALWHERGEPLAALGDRPGWRGLTARALAAEGTPDEFALLQAASAEGDLALASALAWLGAQAERLGDAPRARDRYQGSVQACARASGHAGARPAPGTHLGGTWAFRRLLAR